MLSEAFERRTSAGKQVQWADSSGSDGGNGDVRKDKDGFRAASGRAGRNDTAKSRADTAMETLFASDDGDDDNHGGGGAASRQDLGSSARRPKTTVLDERSVLFCGLTLSVDDFVRARAAKTGESKEYSVSQERKAFLAETRDPIAKSSVSRMAESQVSSVSQECKESSVSRMAEAKVDSPPMFSPVMSSPLSQRRGARIQRRESRKEGIVVEKGSSSEEEMDLEQIEFGILQGDVAEAVVDEGSMKKEEAVFSRVSSTESVKKEMKKRKKKPGPRRASMPDDFNRVPSTDSQTFERAASADSENEDAAVRRPRSSEAALKLEAGKVKIAALEQAMTIEKVQAFDSSLVVNYDDEQFQKIYELDLDGADEGDDPVIPSLPLPGVRVLRGYTFRALDPAGHQRFPCTWRLPPLNFCLLARILNIWHHRCSRRCGEVASRICGA
jgi:hypothetical protein